MRAVWVVPRSRVRRAGQCLGKKYRCNTDGDGPPTCNEGRARHHHIDQMATWQSLARVRADIRAMSEWARLEMVDRVAGTVRHTWQLGGDGVELELQRRPGAHIA